MENSNKNDINPNLQQGAVRGSINLSEEEVKEGWFACPPDLLSFTSMCPNQEHFWLKSSAEGQSGGYKILVRDGVVYLKKSVVTPPSFLSQLKSLVELTKSYVQSCVNVFYQKQSKKNNSQPMFHRVGQGLLM